MSAPAFNADFADMIGALRKAGAEFIVVGAHALAAHGIARATGDFDILVRPSPENAQRVFRALIDFAAPVAAHGIAARDFEMPGTVYQMGLPPRRIDILTAITGVTFDRAWDTKLEVTVADETFPVLGREALLENKRATGRPKDLLDVELLEKAGRGL